LTTDLAAYLQRVATAQEQFLDLLSRRTQASPHARALTNLTRAIEHATGNAGKRLRPTLAYAAYDAVAEADWRSELDAVACAVECIHTYSLIHDDLPAMDDDDLRRGQPTLHKAFDEATAILVGDGLQALAFELVSGAQGLPAEHRAAITLDLARASGFEGMVGGQFLDMEATARKVSQAELEEIHGLKTGALIRASLLAGARVAGATPAQLEALDAYGGCLGLAFQVIDDVLDVTASSEVLGKTGGKDAATDKATYVRLLGIDGARQQARSLVEESLSHLQSLGSRAVTLEQLAHYVIDRDR
jgi:geranylgeranyl pyrophosphate synthase